MGSLLSVSIIKSELSKVMDVEQVNEVISQINTVMRSKNEIRIHNVGEVSNINAKFTTLIKNQIISKIILDAASKTSFYDKILNQINEKQQLDGLFQLDASILDHERSVKEKLGVDQINREIENIRASFNIGNSFIIENDQLIPSSSVHDINLELTNTLFQEQVSDMLNSIDSEIKTETKSEDTVTKSQSSSNTLILIAVAGVAALWLLNQNKK